MRVRQIDFDRDMSSPPVLSVPQPKPPGARTVNRGQERAPGLPARLMHATELVSLSPGPS